MNTWPEKDNETMKSHFPDGLQVLAIDDNVVCLKILGSLLHKCGYKVTTKRSAMEALEMLRKSGDSFDIVITDVMRSDMDGFKLLEIIGLGMDLPVIMTSANGDTRSVVEGIKHGARDYIVKPVQLKDLKNIWQHANRKSSSEEEAVVEGSLQPLKKSGDKSSNDEKDEPMEESGAKKKCRLNWSRELHAKFLEAYHKLDGDTSDKVVPKRILEIMNEPGLTRENVASHLQKFRSGLKKKKMEKQSQVCSTDTTSSTKTRDNTLCKYNKTKIAPRLSRMPIATYSLPKPAEISTPNYINQKPLFLNQNQLDFVLQKYPYATQMLDPLLPDYPTLAADDHGVKFPAFHQRITARDDCAETQQFVQAGFPAALVPGSLVRPAISPYSGASYLMPGDVSSQMSPVSDFVSGGNLAGSTLGHTKGGSCVTPCTNIRGNQLLEGSAGIDDDTRFVQLLLENYSKRESNGQHNNWTSPNDDDYSGKNIFTFSF